MNTVNKWSKTLAALVLGAAVTQVQAAELITPYTFSAGNQAVAAEVNENFAAVETAVNDTDERVTVNADTLAQLIETVDALKGRVDTLEQDLATAETTISNLEANSVLQLDGMLTYDTTGTYPAAVFSGINVQVVNGASSTASSNGTGNLIIGYNETPSVVARTGSHYLVVGTGHSYTQYAGIVAGSGNAATGPYATISGGYRNTASGSYSSVSGGYDNTASGSYSSVSGGGYNNTASGAYSSISGGNYNTASGSYSSVSGGASNTASGSYSSVSGGYNNTASGERSSVSGGRGSIAGGNDSSVSGGYAHDLIYDMEWAAGRPQ